MKASAIIKGLAREDGVASIEFTIGSKPHATGFEYDFVPEFCTFELQGAKVTLTSKRASVETDREIIHCVVATKTLLAQCTGLEFPQVLVRLVFNLPRKIVAVEFIQAK